MSELPLKPAAETVLASELVLLLSRKLVLAATADAIVMRISENGADREYLSLTPERAMSLGANLMRGALRIKPQLRAQVIEGGDASVLCAIAGEGAANG